MLRRSEPGVAVCDPYPTTFNRPLAFEPNRGQAPAQVSWTARGQGYQLFLTSSGATITIAEPVAPSPEDPHLAIPGRPALLSGRVSAIGMHLVGSHPWTAVQAMEPTGAVSNYLMGSDRANWRSGIPQYHRLQVKGVYDGIDLVFYGHGRDLEYDFVLAPGADPNQIRLAFDGAGPLRIDRETGDLVIKTNSGSEMRHVRPHVYQQIGNENREVAGGFQILDNGEAAFHLASYDRQHALVVDPTVEFTTFIEGNSKDIVESLAVDSYGNSYITGLTLSTNFPNFFGPAPAKTCVQSNCPAWIFVTELSPSGEVMNSTLIGGSETDDAFGIAVDPTGVWVAGMTTSTNFATHTQFGWGVRPPIGELYALADANTGLGDVACAIGKRISGHSSVEHYRESRAFYQRSLAIWSEIPEPAIISPWAFFSVTPARVSSRLAKCGSG